VSSSFAHRAAPLTGLAVLGLLLLGWPGLVAQEPLGYQAAAFSLVWLLCLTLLARRQGTYGPGPIYLVLFGLFHGGLLLTAALRGIGAVPAAAVGWLLSPYTPAATWLVTLAMLAFTSAALAGRARPTSTVDKGAGDPHLGAVLGAVGLASLGTGLLVFAAVLQRAGGIDALTSGYGTFLDRLDSGSPLGYGTLLIGLGTVFAVVAGGRYRIAGWLAFTAFALVALPLGTRGVVMFPLAALVVIEARRGWRLRLPVALGLGVAVLALVSVVRTTRLAGVGGLLSGSWTASPLDAVAEMGHSLRPTVAVLGWHGLGEPFRGGITFVSVFVRAIEQLTGWHGGSPLVDDRIFNQEILVRVGPIGGSPVAESYHNLGVAGVIGVMALFGLVIGLLERRPRGVLADATLGIVLLPLLTEVRNSAAPLLTHLALGFMLLLAVRLVARWRTGLARRHRPERVPEPVPLPRAADDASPARPCPLVPRR
jgi:hypothetical protein